MDLKVCSSRSSHGVPRTFWLCLMCMHLSHHPFNVPFLSQGAFLVKRAVKKDLGVKYNNLRLIKPNIIESLDLESNLDDKKEAKIMNKP